MTAPLPTLPRTGETDPPTTGSPVVPAQTLGRGAETTAMIADELLAGLASLDHPAARALQDQVRAHVWRPEDRIEPEAVTQEGQTHILRAPLVPPQRTAAAAIAPMYGNQWAGGVVSGTWTAAYGVWRVP